MKDYELLDMIGEVNGDYILAAGENMSQPRLRWNTWAVCAACAALIVAAYPAYQAFFPQKSASNSAADSDSALEDLEAARDSDDELIQSAGLHGYTLVEGGVMATLGDAKAQTGGGVDVPGQVAPVPEPAQPPRGDGPSDISGGGASADSGAGKQGTDAIGYSAPVQDAPVQEYAAGQYDKLLRGMGMQVEGAASYPDWFAGAWIDWETLHVAIVDSLRTQPLESQIEGWCGSGVVFQSAKYSHNFLNSLMEPVAALLDGTDLCCGIGVDVSANCLGLDIYGESIPDTVLAQLAALDPAGDAIRVRLFVETLSLADDVGKGPAPDRSAADPVFDGARVGPSVEAEPTPAPAEDSEWTIPAADPGAIEDLPQAKYDIIEGGS